MKRNNNIELMKFISALGIILIHTGNFYRKIGGVDDQLFYFLTYTLRFAVPLFFMFSGYFYYTSKNKAKSIKSNATYYFLMLTIYGAGTFIAQQLGFIELRFMTIFWFFQVLTVSQILTYCTNTIWNIILFIIVLLPRLNPNYSAVDDYSFLVFGLAFLIGYMYSKFKLSARLPKSNIYMIIALPFILINPLKLHLGQWENLEFITATIVFIATLQATKQVKPRKIYSKSLELYLFHMIFLSIIRYYFLNVTMYDQFLNSYMIIPLAIVNFFITLIIAKIAMPKINKLLTS